MYINELLTETADKCNIDNENVQPFSVMVFIIQGRLTLSQIGLKIKSRLHVWPCNHFDPHTKLGSQQEDACIIIRIQSTLRIHICSVHG